MKTAWLDRRIDYDGSQLRAHWILRETGLEGDALVAFRGRCAVTLDEMADLADVDGPGIAADDMVHFLWESFDDARLDEGILRQRLLACLVAESLVATGTSPTLRRDGDDLYGPDDRKLSISIATTSPVSSLLHFAVNVRRDGVPVDAWALSDLGVEPEPFARDVLARAAAEFSSVRAARVKIRAKGETR